MSNSTLNPQSIFPDLPRDMSVGKDGKLNDLLQLGLASAFQALQQNFSNEGILFPPLTQDEQNAILSIYTPYIGKSLPITLPDVSGKTIFDSTNRVPKQFIMIFDYTKDPAILISAQWMMLNVMTFNAGDPNHVLSGAANWFCYDTAGHVLYSCTTSGDAASAIWTAV